MIAARVVNNAHKKRHIGYLGDAAKSPQTPMSMFIMSSVCLAVSSVCATSAGSTNAPVNLTLQDESATATQDISDANELSRYHPRVVVEEGRRNLAYRDIFDYITVGVGHNMGLLGEDSDQPVFERVTGVDYLQIKTGGVPLEDPRVDTLLNHDLAKAIEYSRKLVPSFDTLPHEAKEVLVDLAFNLGPSGLRSFKFFRSSIENQDWAQAAWDLSHQNRKENSPPSAYSKQVPNRARRNVDILKALAAKSAR